MPFIIIIYYRGLRERATTGPVTDAKVCCGQYSLESFHARYLTALQGLSLNILLARIFLETTESRCLPFRLSAPPSLQTPACLDSSLSHSDDFSSRVAKGSPLSASLCDADRVIV